MAILLQPSIKRFTSALMFTVPSSKRQPILGFVSVSCEQKQPFLKGGVKDWLIFRMAGIQNHSIYIYIGIQIINVYHIIFFSIRHNVASLLRPMLY